MTDQEILIKAIEKAIAGGFRHSDYPEEVLDVGAVFYYFDDDHGNLSINDLIWRHDFAKALWGEKEAGTEDFYSPEHNELSGSSWPTMWQYHLQQMVIAKDPIAYLGEHI